MRKLIIIILSVWSLNLMAQDTPSDTTLKYKYRLSLPVIILPQLVEKSWNDRMHTQHIEFHLKRNLDNKNIIGLKLASWRLFQPMGIQWWDDLLDKLDTESEFYPGHVRETGIGVSYQRMLWKGFFATVEVLPQIKTYLDEDNNKIGKNGFKLYNSIHLGYHFAFGKKKRLFIEPQFHSQFWVFDSEAPTGFAEKDDQWKNYFLFEPNIYFGIKF